MRPAGRRGAADPSLRQPVDILGVNRLTHHVPDRITYTLHHLVDLLDRHADAMLAAHGLTFSEFVFLAVLEECEPQDVTQMARSLGVTKAAVSKRVPRLVRRGLVRTDADPANARRVVLTLTGEGLRLAREAGTALDAEFTRLFEERTDLDLGRTHADLRAMITALETKELP